MISGVEGLKIKPLTTFKNDGVKRHSGIESFSTVLKSSEKKADASDKVQENSDKTDTESSSKNSATQGTDTASGNKILYTNATTGETYTYTDVADDNNTKTSSTSKSSNTTTVDSMKKTKYDAIFKKAAKKYGVSESLLKAVAKAESDFNPNDVSSAGAVGVMQLMPSTAKELGVKNPYDAEQNIMGGAKLIAAHLKKFNGNVRYALAAYNAGSGAVKRYGGVPSYCKTYVNRVLSYKKAYETANAVG